MKKLGCLFTALVLPFLPCFGSALAANFKFDPAACKENTGSFYVALGHSVFETPGATMGNVVIDPIEDDPGSKPLKAPDPNEPKGCFGNPLQSNSHSILHDIAVKDTGSGLTRHMVPDLFQLINLNRGSHSQDGEWPGERMVRDLVEDACKRTTLHEDLANGLIACRIKPANPPNARQEDWAAGYTAKPEIYLTPLGKTFDIDCGPGLFSHGIGQCDVAYAINSDVGLAYRFQPYRSGHPIPIDQIIAYDRSLREAIGNALVKNYPWPNQ
jgi:hypothetical protein